MNKEPKLIQKYTVDSYHHTKIVSIYLCVDSEGFGYYEAVGQYQGVDAGPGANWQNDDLYTIIKEVKEWL